MLTNNSLNLEIISIFAFFFPASFTATQSADLSTLFDVGGIIGGIIAGVLSDYTGMSAVTCAVMLVIAIPMVCFTF